MKRGSENKRSKMRRKVKYLLLLLLLSFNFSFAWVHINKLNEKINQLNMELATQQNHIEDLHGKVDLVQSVVTAHEIKINILSNLEPGKIVHTITKVVESVPIEPSQIHMFDPGVIVSTVGALGVTVVSVFHHILGGLQP